jgi:hypothetical protein
MSNGAEKSWAAPFLRIFDYLRLGENASIVIISTFIEILGGFGAIGFRMLIDGLQNLTIQKSGTTILERLAESLVLVESKDAIERMKREL